MRLSRHPLGMAPRHEGPARRVEALATLGVQISYRESSLQAPQDLELELELELELDLDLKQLVLELDLELVSCRANLKEQRWRLAAVTPQGP